MILYFIKDKDEKKKAIEPDLKKFHVLLYHISLTFTNSECQLLTIQTWVQDIELNDNSSSK